MFDGQHERMRPMLAIAGPQPIGAEWLHEVKWDGLRILADVSQSGLQLLSRVGRDVTGSFPELEPVTGTVRDALIDGEVIMLRNGVPSHEALTDRLRGTDARRTRRLAEDEPATVMAFDLLRLYGVDLTGRPLTERRASLERLRLPAESWRTSPRYDDGPALLSATREQGLEGVVAKRSGSTYQPGRRSPDWVKTAHRRHQACVVGGWLPATEDGVAALLVGLPDGAGLLRYAGRVERGIGGGSGQDLRRLLSAIPAETAPFATPFDGPPDGPTDTPSDGLLDGGTESACWCRPRLVIEVRHLGWSPARRMREPVFRGVRTDLDAAEVRDES